MINSKSLNDSASLEGGCLADIRELHAAMLRSTKEVEVRLFWRASGSSITQKFH
jgi:hypothetical protein